MGCGWWRCVIGECNCRVLDALSKEVWKILPSYEELRRGAIGRGREVDVNIRCHVSEGVWFWY